MGAGRHGTRLGQPATSTVSRLLADLLAEFLLLETPTAAEGAGARFTAAPIDDYPRHRVAKDSSGRPCLLVSVSAGSTPGPPIVLEHVSLQHDVECRITHPDGRSETGRFTVLRCTQGDPALDEYFLRVCGTILAVVGQQPSDLQVRAAMDRVVELFRAIDAPPRKTVQGLWAELLVIARSRDILAMARAWHSLPGDRYDFSSGTQRVEVKAAMGQVRRHHFQLDQVIPVPGTAVIIASLLVQRAGAGTSVRDLLSEIRSAASAEPPVVLQVDQVTALTLGSGWRQALDEQFDRHFAENSLAFFSAAGIPKPDAALPAGVTEVRFCADLTAVTRLEPGGMRDQGGLLRAILPN